MDNFKNLSLSERLDGVQVAQFCINKLVHMTIGEYFGKYEKELNVFLALPAARKWHLSADDSLYKIMLATDSGIKGSKDYVTGKIHRAVDLIIHPVVSSEYLYPFFCLSLNSFINNTDAYTSDIERHNNMRKNWQNLTDKSLNAIVRYFNKSTDENIKYDWLDGILTIFFEDLESIYKFYNEGWIQVDTNDIPYEFKERKDK